MNRPAGEQTPQGHNIWQDAGSLSREIESKAEPIDYGKMLGDAQVLMLGEDFLDRSVRKHLIKRAGDFKQAGFTHFAVEINPEEPLGKLCENPQELNSLPNRIPYNTEYGETIKALMLEGIKVVPIDMDQSTRPTADQREEHLTKDIVQILEADPNARVAVLISSGHALKSDMPDADGKEWPRAWVAVQLERQGIGLVSAQYIGGNEPSPTFFNGAAKEAGLSHKEFMMDLRPYRDQDGVVFGAGTTDFLIHLPQTSDGRRMGNLVMHMPVHDAHADNPKPYSPVFKNRELPTPPPPPKPSPSPLP